jgi:hypothetical protein
MKEKNYTGVIPSQESGSSLRAESSVELNSEEEAQSFFQIVKQRLLDVNNWKKFAGTFSANFELTDESGRKVDGEAKKGFYFRIDVPGPGTKSGEGYDWAQIEEIKTISEPGIESLAIRVRPAKKPLDNSPDISHFYSEQSTSTFTLTREGKKITIAVYDRNLKPNSEAEEGIDKLRNVFVGSAGIAAFSKLQWKALTNGLLEEKN